jgi:hypothetical protein
MSFRRMRHTKAREWQGCDVAYDFSRPASLYDATSGGSLVASGAAIARAEDQSGNGAHMTQSSSTLRPLRIVAAQRGLDAARFDGSNDYMTAGDVADIGLGQVEMTVVFKRTGGGSVVGYFGKSLANNPVGRWSLLKETNDEALMQLNVGLGDAAALSSSPTTWQVLHGRTPRVNASQVQTIIRRNGGTEANGSTYTADTTTNLNTTHSVFIGAYQDSSGTSPFAGSYLPGDVGEAAKWSVAMNNAARRRWELSRARKWGIAT